MLAHTSLRLLPILYKRYKHSISGCSKAPTGSFRPVAGNLHLHRYYNSPSLSLRQCPDRCAFRAGRNLPDKEFRYLRTVIVTAAVYWGLQFVPSPKLSTPLNLPAPGRRQPLYVTLRFCRDLCFAKQCAWAYSLRLSRACTLIEHPFSRSYGVILPSSLTRVLSLTLGFSPHLPVSVCGTGSTTLPRGFS